MKSTDNQLTELREYISTQQQHRGWTNSEFARRAGIARSSLRRALGTEEDYAPNVDVLMGIARALEIPVEGLLRMARILDPEPTQTRDSRELLRMFEAMDGQLQQEVMHYIRYMYSRRSTVFAEDG